MLNNDQEEQKCSPFEVLEKGGYSDGISIHFMVSLEICQEISE